MNLSSVVLCVVIALALAVWLPRKARRGMREAEKHEEARFSPSLRILSPQSDEDEKEAENKAGGKLFEKNELAVKSESSAKTESVSSDKRSPKLYSCMRYPHSLSSGYSSRGKQIAGAEIDFTENGQPDNRSQSQTENVGDHNDRAESREKKRIISGRKKQQRKQQRKTAVPALKRAKPSDAGAVKREGAMESVKKTLKAGGKTAESSDRKSGVNSAQKNDMCKHANNVVNVARVKQIRAQRRAAAARRSKISAALFLCTVLTAAVSCTGLFSALWALVPGLLLAVVLALGVRVSAQARKWEENLIAVSDAKMRALKTNNAKAGSAQNVSAQAQTGKSGDAESASGKSAGNSFEKTSAKTVNDRFVTVIPDDVSAKDSADFEAAGDYADDCGSDSSRMPTAVLSSADIKKALRGKSASETSSEKNARSRKEKQAKKAETGVKTGTGVKSAAKSKKTESDSAVKISDVAAQTAEAVSASKPDLISFSLGTPGKTAYENEAEQIVHSLEIKSYKQVSKAVPKKKSDSKEESAADKISDEIAKAERIESAERKKLSERDELSEHGKSAEGKEPSDREKAEQRDSFNLDDVMARRRG